MTGGALRVLAAIAGGAALYGLLRLGGYFYKGASCPLEARSPTRSGRPMVPAARTIDWRETSTQTEALVSDWVSSLCQTGKMRKVTALVLMAKLALGLTWMP